MVRQNSLLLISGSILLLLVTGIVLLWSLSSGEYPLSLREILFHRNSFSEIDTTILYTLRMPRSMLAFSVGSSLATAGVILQAVYRNPMIEPYTLGISGGASFAVAMAVILPIPLIPPQILLPVAGFIGAMGVTLLLYIPTPGQSLVQRHTTILLRGIMISFLASSLVLLIISLSPAHTISEILNWLMGSLEQPFRPLVYLSGITSILGLLLALLSTASINALYLGFDEAHTLGISPQRILPLLFFLAAILTGVSVAATGIIGFVGLVIPHTVRIVTGNDHLPLLLFSWFGGGIFLLVCDTLARTLFVPIELPVGVLTGIIGAVVFLFLLKDTKGEYSL
ncbi:FecCD family ABC transporter permease [Chitinivibrio alkaliphilus]|uniref:ABC transporter, permease protein n=1 Tax=Chitinivibrio alkaliphilus ACht1 TaxID=1313304 RepID=U7DC80_9BACT|nr:iron ABC transporter permease [Chitinivibrio alkaliphilus]ERP39183.1 ABC transporter, permease protein [Chitinivibrio alkaliphilus ACht1]